MRVREHVKIGLDRGRIILSLYLILVLYTVVVVEMMVVVVVIDDHDADDDDMLIMMMMIMLFFHHFFFLFTDIELHTPTKLGLRPTAERVDFAVESFKTYEKKVLCQRENRCNGFILCKIVKFQFNLAQKTEKTHVPKNYF